MSKLLRFEVFKRDSFTCQYCGGQAPDVLLQVDHINPVASGGTNDLVNLITACQPCNNGKGARQLSDDSAVKRQRAQIELLEERREQLEMMLQWRDAAEREKIDIVEAIAERCAERGSFIPNESGRANIRRWLKTYTLPELLAALDNSFDSYMKWSGDDPDQDAWEVAFKKIPAVASINRQSAEKPYLRDVLYIQGILRRRTGDRRVNCFAALESFVLDGLPTEKMKEIACRVDSWRDFDTEAEQALSEMSKGE